MRNLKFVKLCLNFVNRTMLIMLKKNRVNAPKTYHLIMDKNVLLAICPNIGTIKKKIVNGALKTQSTILI